MRSRFLLCALAFSILAGCGGGGGGTGPGGPPVVHATATPQATSAPYPTLAPASTRQGDVKTLATGGGASSIAYWPDYNVVVVGDGPQIIDAADSSVIAKTPDMNVVIAVAYAQSNHSIYFATPTNIYSFAYGGAVLTVAANLGHIESLAIASDGTVYAIDTDHIVKINGGVATNLTPPGSMGTYASGAYPSMAFATDGTLFVSDPQNDVIDRVNMSGGITPFAGSCKAAAGGFTGTGGSCWRVAQAGTGSSANFGLPAGLAYDSTTGTLYVADMQDNQLWSVSSSGAASPVAGYGAAFNADGNGLAAFLDAPISLTLQSSSHAVDVLESAQAGQQEIAAYTAVGTAPPAYTAPALPVYFPNGLAISELGASPDGSAWTADTNGKNLVRVSSTGAVTRYATPSGIVTSWHVAVDANGNAFYLASRFGSNGLPTDQGVLEVTPSGTETYVAAQPQHTGAPSFITMEAITMGPDGNPWFTESETSLYGGSYGLFNSTTHTITQYALSTQPGGISQAPGGDLAIATMVAGKSGIIFASTTGQTVASYQAALTTPISLQYRASDQTVWFNDAMAIGSMTSNGTVQEYGVCSNCGPINLTVSPDGSVWSDTTYSGIIMRVPPGGSTSYYLLPISFGPTYGISARADGKLWVYNNFGVLYLFDPAVYDAMNGPHAIQSVNGRASDIGTGWHRW